MSEEWWMGCDVVANMFWDMFQDEQLEKLEEKALRATRWRDGLHGRCMSLPTCFILCFIFISIYDIYLFFDFVGREY